MRLRNPLFVAVNFCVAMVAIGCGGGGSGRQTPPPPAPMFASTPITVASEGNAYSYPIAATDPAGGTVSFALASGPAGAVITGNTLTWTPTPEESRVGNSFRITATTSGGGTGTQTFSVTPTGTVHISRVDTIWTADGSSPDPYDWTRYPGEVGEAAAIVPQADGSFQTFTGTGNSDGTLTIPNVPGGYYWLRISSRNTYWTSASNFDFGTDNVGGPSRSTTAAHGNGFEFKVNGLNPWQDGDTLGVSLDNGFGIGIGGLLSTGATSVDVQTNFSTNEDFTTVKSAYVWQTEPLEIGFLKAAVLGPTLQLSNLSLSNTETNTFTGTLAESPKSSVNMDVKGGDWADLYNNAGPVAVTPYDTSFHMAAQPYFTEGLTNNLGNFGNMIPSLFYSSSSFSRFVTTFQVPDTLCDSAPLLPGDNSFPPIVGQAPLLTDQNFGSFQYGDPFRPQWLRVFSYCQEAVVNVPGATSDSPVIVLLGDGVTTAAPTGPVEPLVSVVQNPQINGQSLFTPNTLSAANMDLSWTAPVDRTAPTAYKIEIVFKTTAQIPGPPIPNPPHPPIPGPPVTVTTYATFGRMFTAKTSATLPYPLPPRQNFVVVITALVDGRANFETSPLRIGLPQANSSVVSALMTMSGETPAISRGNGVKFKPTPLVAPVRRDPYSKQIIVPNQN